MTEKERDMKGDYEELSRAVAQLAKRIDVIEKRLDARTRDFTSQLNLNARLTRVEEAFQKIVGDQKT